MFGLFTSSSFADPSSKDAAVPTVHVESLEERALFSADLGASGVPSDVVFENPYQTSQVYDLPLVIAPASAKIAGPGSPAAAKHVGGLHVQLTNSADQTIVTGIYTEAAQPLRDLVHPVNAAISARGTTALETHDTMSFAGRPPTAKKDTHPTTTKRRVLLIEDDPTSRLALATLLTRRGWEVTSASTMAEGLSQLSENPDNVIVDLMLPDGEGEQVVQEIRDSHRTAKVTVMTGVSDPARLARLHDLHPESVLNKPIDIAALLRAISNSN